MSLSQSLALMNGDWSRVTDYPIALALLVLAVLSAGWFLTRRSPQPADAHAAQ